MDEGWAARQTGTRDMELATTKSGPGSFVHFLQEMDKKKMRLTCRYILGCALRAETASKLPRVSSASSAATKSCTKTATVHPPWGLVFLDFQA